jgi:perosamine synthetase
MPVHVLGNMCDMPRLLQIASRYRINIIEDATEALGSYHLKKHAGAFGLVSALSFNGNKIITTGGGGMILTSNPDIAKKAKHITTQAKADKDEYYHDEIGYNYRLVNILAAMGVAQMEQLPGFLKRKNQITATYNETLLKMEGIRCQKVTENVTCNHWLYTVKAPRQPELRKFLQQNEVEARPFWVPMNRLPAFTNNIYYQHKDVSGEVYAACVSLPCSTNITDAEIEQVIKLVQKFYCGR